LARINARIQAPSHSRGPCIQDPDKEVLVLRNTGPCWLASLAFGSLAIAQESAAIFDVPNVVLTQFMVSNPPFDQLLDIDGDGRMDAVGMSVWDDYDNSPDVDGRPDALPPRRVPRSGRAAGVVDDAAAEDPIRDLRAAPARGPIRAAA
jgi:hypothetical protein